MRNLLRLYAFKLYPCIQTYIHLYVDTCTSLYVQRSVWITLSLSFSLSEEDGWSVHYNTQKSQRNNFLLRRSKPFSSVDDVRAEVINPQGQRSHTDSVHLSLSLSLALSLSRSLTLSLCGGWVYIGQDTQLCSHM